MVSEDSCRLLRPDLQHSLISLRHSGGFGQQVGLLLDIGASFSASVDASGASLVIAARRIPTAGDKSPATHGRRSAAQRR